MNKKTFYTTALVTFSLLSGGFVGHVYASDQTSRTPEVVQGELSALRELPSSRTNNLKIQNLEKELLRLQSGGGQPPVSTVPSPLPTPSPVITAVQPPVSTVPSLQPTSPSSIGAPTSRTPEVVQGELSALRELPSSRTNTLKIQNLERELLRLQSGGGQPPVSTVPSPHPTPSPLLTGGPLSVSTVPSPDPTPSPVITGGQPSVSMVPSPHPTPSPLLTGAQPSSSTTAPSAAVELGALVNEFAQLTKLPGGQKRDVTLTEITDFIAKVEALQRAVLDTHTKSLSSIEEGALESLQQKAVLAKTTATSVAQTSQAVSERQQKLVELDAKINEMKQFVKDGGEGGLLSKRFGKLDVLKKAEAHKVATDAIALIEELLVKPKDAQQKKSLEKNRQLLREDLLALNS